VARALVLRHHLEDNAGLVGEAFESRGYEIDLRMMNASTTSPSLNGADVFVILGSYSAVYDTEVEQAWFGRELELIADAHRRDLPIFGICFGAQALCLFHGGVVERSNFPEVGWYEVEARNGSGIAKGPWFQYHFDHCVLPEGAQLWATTPRAVQAFSVGRNVGVQFHPEIDDVQLRSWFASSDEDARALGIDVEALIEQTRQETPSARGRALDLVDLFLTHIER
jgi:GMP synthase-like glutamine amidotransferase